jgi:mono/diheme cytochrome c family protein
MKRSISHAVVGIAVFSLGLAGCGGDRYPAYSSGVKYGLRADPIVRVGKELGDERYDPDRPGVFPVMKLDDAFKLDHPYFAKSKVILAGALKEIIDKTNPNASADQRKALEDQLLQNPGSHRARFARGMDKVLRDPTQIQDKDRKELEAALEAAFGTPAKPTINAKEAGIDEKTIAELKLDDKTLADGSTFYRVHCLHCHGVPGDGRGPTARWINPHPRDFRGGMFKFQSVDRTSAISRPPARADLLRTLRQGIEGTAMPSFNLLKDDELEPIISYVIHLSLRGNIEATLMTSIFEWDDKDKADNPVLVVSKNEENGKPEDFSENIKFYTKKLINTGWAEANKPEAAIKVAPYPFDPDDREALEASVKRGKQIFIAEISPELKKHFIDRNLPKRDNKGPAQLTPEAEKALGAKADATLSAVKCVTCHIDFGRQAKFKFDEWGTLVRPNNLPNGGLRGGKRPVDIYYRIHSGIPGSEMTPFGKTFEGNELYIWDLVNFVSALPYPAMREQFKLRID